MLDHNVADASTFLHGLGLQVVTVPGELVDANDPRLMLVYLAQPVGTLNPGDTVTLTYYQLDTSNTSPSPTPTP